MFPSGTALSLEYDCCKVEPDDEKDLLFLENFRKDRMKNDGTTAPGIFCAFQLIENEDNGEIKLKNLGINLDVIPAPSD